MTAKQETTHSSKQKPEPKADLLQEEIAKILEARGTSLPANKAKEIAITIATRFSGPIPPPHILEEYERILSGSAHRILASFEEQYRHRIDLEKKSIKAQLFQSGLGQIIGGVSVLACLGITAWMGFLGHTVLAGILGSSSVIGLATIYFLGKKAQQSSLRA